MQEVLDVMRLALLCTTDAVEGEFCLPEVPEMTRCMLLYMLEVVEGGLEAQRCGQWILFAGRVGGAGDVGGDTLHGTLYARSCGW